MTGRSTIVVRLAGHDRRSGKRTATGSSSTRFPTSRPATASSRRSPTLVNEGRIKGISDVRDESDLKEPVRLVIDLKSDADPDVVLNQLYQFSPLQDTFSIILLALVDGKPRTLHAQGDAARSSCGTA